MTHLVPEPLKPYVRSVRSLQVNSPGHEVHHLPFYADGCPGIMHIESENAVRLNGNRQLTSLFLYGQTVKPIEIATRGSYRAIIMILYPHVIKHLFGIRARELTDGCLDFEFLPGSNPKFLKSRLKEETNGSMKIKSLSNYLTGLSILNNSVPDTDAGFATSVLMKTGGSASLRSILKDLRISERTFERKFRDHVGINPRLFARICKFQKVLDGMQAAEFTKLTDIAYDNGFSDQSHFIRTFREFTGSTPGEFLSKMAVNQD